MFEICPRRFFETFFQSLCSFAPVGLETPLLQCHCVGASAPQGFRTLTGIADEPGAFEFRFDRVIQCETSISLCRPQFFFQQGRLRTWVPSTWETTKTTEIVQPSKHSKTSEPCEEEHV